MRKSNKHYTTYDKDLIMAAMKIGAQNGIPQEIIADQIAPLLFRKPSAIVSQMYLMRSDWVKTIQRETILAHSKVKHDGDGIKTNETEYNPAPETKTQTKETPNEIEMIEFTPVLQPEPPETPKRLALPALPAIGDEINVVVISIRDFGAIVKAVDYDIMGLIHISNISNHYVTNVGDWLKVGQPLNAIVLKQEPGGRYKLSAKDATNDLIATTQKISN